MINIMRQILLTFGILVVSVLESFGQIPEGAFNSLSVSYKDGRNEKINISTETNISFDAGNTMTIASRDKALAIILDEVSYFSFSKENMSGIEVFDNDTAITFDGKIISIDSSEVFVYDLSGLLLKHIAQQAPIKINTNELSHGQPIIIRYNDNRTIKIFAK